MATNVKPTKGTTRKPSTARQKRPVKRPEPTPQPEPPALIEMRQQRCLVPNCPRYEVRRGLCHPCAADAGALVRLGRVTWEDLEATGKARKPEAEAVRGDLPHRRAWFLGEWQPGDPWPMPAVEGGASAPAGADATEA